MNSSATWRLSCLLLVALAGSSLTGQSVRPVAPTGEAPTFSKDVAPIVYKNCVSCHRPGEVAPMSLITYKDVRPWATAIREKVAARVMPPWGADPQHGRFRNDPSLKAADIDTIVKWVDGGSREGDPAAMPPLPQFAEGWQIGKPDAVFEMPADYQVPAKGTIDYQYFEVQTNFTEDKWMQAGEVRAGDRAHVHHIIVYVRDPQPSPRPNVMSVRPILASNSPATGGPVLQTVAARAQTAQAPATSPAQARAAVSRTGDNMLVNWAVGEDAPVYQRGMAKRIPKGSTLVFQVHYTTNGTPGTDRSKIGLVFAKEPPAREIRTGMILNTGFAIPPNAANHEVAAEATFSEDVKVWTMHPHMHLRGKDMTYTVTYPDGRRDIALRVPKFDFGWQTDYWLAEPLSLSKGSKITVSAHFDNSAANRNNPDPAKSVRWGDQTWEEMMIGFFTYSVGI
jgi:hypothetical protein